MSSNLTIKLVVWLNIAHPLLNSTMDSVPHPSIFVPTNQDTEGLLSSTVLDITCHYFSINITFQNPLQKNSHICVPSKHRRRYRHKSMLGVSIGPGSIPGIFGIKTFISNKSSTLWSCKAKIPSRTRTWHE